MGTHAKKSLAIRAWAWVKSNRLRLVIGAAVAAVWFGGTWMVASAVATDDTIITPAPALEVEEDGVGTLPGGTYTKIGENVSGLAFCIYELPCSD